MSKGILGFGVLSSHIINPRPLAFSVAQRIKELVDLKTKKNSKSRKKRKQNTEDEGKGDTACREPRGRTALT